MSLHPSHFPLTPPGCPLLSVSSRSSPFGSTAIPGVGPNGTQQLVTDPTLARDKRRTNAGAGAGKGSEGRGFSLLTMALVGVTTFMLGKASITRL